MAEQSRVEVVDSILNHAPKDAVTWRADNFRKFIERVGYSGIALLPIRSVLAWDILRGKDKGLVKAIHQPYREESAFGIVRNALGKLPQAKDAVFDLLMNFDMPPLDHGNRVAARVQRRLENKVPYVAHPYGQVLGDALSDPSHPPDPRPDYRGLRKSGIFSDVQWQMTAELAHHRGTLSKDPIKTIQDTVEVMRGDGFGRVAWDTNHAQAERQGHRLPSPEKMVGWLATNRELGAFEFSAQPRLGGDRADLSKTLGGNIELTPHGEMLAAAADNTPPGETFHLKVEVPAYAFEDIGLHYQRGHELLVPILQSYTNQHLQTA